jgi:hypothetical protein
MCTFIQTLGTEGCPNNNTKAKTMKEKINSSTTQDFYMSKA